MRLMSASNSNKSTLKKHEANTEKLRKVRERKSKRKESQLPNLQSAKQIAKIIKDATKSPQQQIACLRKLRSIANVNDANKKCMEAAGAVEFLASIVNSFNSLSFEESTSDGDAIESLTNVLQNGNYESRAYASLLLKSVFEVADPMQLINLRTQLFVEIVQVLRDQISHQASKAALQLFVSLCPWGRNRIRAVEANAVSVLIDLLLDSTEKRACEMALIVLDLLCQCAEGRAEFLRHGAGLAVVSKKILRVSQVASEKAVRILLSVSKFSTTSSVLQEMLQIGVVAKLCLVLQVDCGSKTKEKAKEVLKLHARAWKNSACIPANLLSFYPA
ncbi:hypothetical protein GH714_037443 [Hevea brasiliensis]|uniref:U-box domain-containing protein n=1 Tax=Hevea brasiliensis TaxID=3981 RepID=A0A6A6KQ97_HEVBR|nr:hypothetical protein GH714_037443 [Hevea brasiliensis]